MYKPEWIGPIEGYTVNYLAKHYWRVARIMDRDDAKQEAHLVFLRCQARYEVKDPPHFMALYKRMLHQHFDDLSTKSTKVRAELTAGRHDDSEDVMLPSEPEGDLDVDAVILELIKKMPAEIRAVVALMLQGPDRQVDYILEQLNKGGPRTYQAAVTRINALLGQPSTWDGVQETRNYFLH